MTGDLTVTSTPLIRHVGVLSRAGLLTTRKVGRRRVCHLNAMPVIELARRWLDDYGLATGTALLDLRAAVEHPTPGRTTMTDTPPPGTSPAGTVSHVSTIVIAATPDRVWAALTETELSARWYFGTGVHSTWVPGEGYRYRAADGTVAIEGVVERCEPPVLLAMTFHARWDERAVADPVSRVVWELVAEGSLTRVTLVHTGLVAGSATARSVARGWPYLLSNLKTVLETGTPMPA